MIIKVIFNNKCLGLCVFLCVVGFVQTAASAGGGVGFRETLKFVPSELDDDDMFGSVGLDGDWMAIGASKDDDMGTDSGAVYIYQRDQQQQWIFRQKVYDDNPGNYEGFGIDIDIQDDLMLIGSWFDNQCGYNSAGAVHVFELIDGSWQFVNTICAEEPAADDNFGVGVGLQGDLAFIGAMSTDDCGIDSGSFYVFSRNQDRTWTEIGQMCADDAQSYAYFGCDVSIDGEMIMFGAWQDDPNGIQEAGSAYIYRHNASGLSMVQKLLASDRQQGDTFGEAVAIEGSLALVGAHWDDENGMENRGSLYVFLEDGNGQWNELYKFSASDPDAFDSFAFRLAIDNGLLLSGAFGVDDDGRQDCGAAYFYDVIWPPLNADFLLPEGVRMEDAAYFSQTWLNDNCFNDMSFCDGSDIDLSGSVDFNDLIEFSFQWLSGI